MQRTHGEQPLQHRWSAILRRWTSIPRRVVPMVLRKAHRCFLWVMLACALVLASPPPAMASSSVSSPSDAIVRQYVHQHMFDDPTPNAVTDTYLERMEDATIGKHPSQIRAMSLPTDTTTIAKRREFGAILTSAIRFVQTQTGVSAGVSMAVLAGIFVIGTPLSFLLFGMIVGGISKRNMDKTFKTRYGENYSVDATLKPDDVEEDSLLEDDDDEDDDEDDDTDDDDNDSE